MPWRFFTWGSGCKMPTASKRGGKHQCYKLTKHRICQCHCKKTKVRTSEQYHWQD